MNEIARKTLMGEYEDEMQQIVENMDTIFQISNATLTAIENSKDRKMYKLYEKQLTNIINVINSYD